MNEQPIWKPNEGPQELALTTEAFEILYGGQRGGGKTDAGQVWLVDPDYLSNPRYRALILRKDTVDLNDWIDRAKYMYSGLDVVAVGNPVEFRFPSGAKFRLGHLKDKNSYEKYLGHEYQKILIEELTQIPQERYYIEIMGSCRSSVEGLTPGMFGTTNPGGIGHLWVKRRFIDPNPPNTMFIGKDTGRTRIFIPARLEDNPIFMAKDPEYVKYLDGLAVSQPKLYQAWRRGNWDIFVGQFFTVWDKSVHVIQPKFGLKNAPESFDYRLSWDDGTTNPRAVHLLIQDNDANVDIAWEYHRTGETASEAAYHIKEELEKIGILDLLKRKGKFIYDPSMDIKNNQTGISSSDIARNILGISKEPGKNSRVEGARKYREFLNWNESQPPLLHIWNTCPSLIETLPTLQYDEHNDEDIDTTGDDHDYDSTRYGLMSFNRMPNRLSRPRVGVDPDMPKWAQSRFGAGSIPKKKPISSRLGI